MFFHQKNIEQDQNPFFYYGGSYSGETTEPFYHSGLMNYTLRVSVATHIGKVRGNHEDNFYLEGLCLNDIFRNDFSATYTTRVSDGMSFAVFDGMGGAAYGEIVSEIAVSILRKYEKKLKKADGTRMLDQLVSAYTTEANDAICDMLTQKHCDVGGTTFSMLYFMGDAVKPYYLGDSRIYCYQSDGLTRLTRDHTVANQKVDAAIYTEEEAKRSPDQHRLTLFIGADRKKIGLNADSRPPIPLEIGNKFLLCTDGLTNMCSDDEIYELLSQNYFNKAAVLIQAALQNGGADNVTCIVLEVLPDALSEEDK